MSISEKIAKIQALIDRATSEGEKEAALLAKERILSKQNQTVIEYTVRSENYWKKQLLIAICRKYGLFTYRYKGQKYTTTMLRVSKELMDECLWPEFLKYEKMLESLVQEVVASVISKIHHSDEEEMVIAGEIGNR